MRVCGARGYVCTVLRMRMCGQNLGMAKKVIVTGASGLLGREVLRSFTGAGWNVLGLAYSRARDGLRKVDLCDPKQVENVLDEFQPQVVIHSAAERRPDVVDKKVDAALALNVNATESLASLCAQRSIYMLYISSDAVFDGKAPPYKPDSITNPISIYGQSKRDGEKAVLKHAGMGVLRLPVLYGTVENLGESSVTTVFSVLLNSEKPGKVSDYERRYPTHVADCAIVCVGLAEKQVKTSDAQGIWHWSGNECLTKYAMAGVMVEVFGLKSDHLIPVREPASGAPRPFDSHLDTSETEKAIRTQQTPFREGIKQAVERFAPAH